MAELNYSDPSVDQGATVVITHRIREGEHASYETWLNEIGPVCRGFPGHLDWQIIRPITGLSGTYTVVIRFDSEQHLKDWMHSEERKRLVEKVRPLFVTDDDFFISTGLDFWFTPEGAKAKVPPRWKQVLVTFIALYPLVLAVPLITGQVYGAMRISEYHLLTTAIGTGLIVLLMAYVVMPYITKLVQRWLFD